MLNLVLLSIQALCMCILLVGRFVNAAVPFAFGEIVRIFEEKSNRSPWPYLFAYVGLRFLQSGGGLSVLKDVNSFLSDLTFNFK